MTYNCFLWVRYKLGLLMRSCDCFVRRSLCLGRCVHLGWWWLVGSSRGGRHRSIICARRLCGTRREGGLSRLWTGHPVCNDWWRISRDLTNSCDNVSNRIWLWGVINPSTNGSSSDGVVPVLLVLRWGRPLELDSCDFGAGDAVLQQISMRRLLWQEKPAVRVRVRGQDQGPGIRVRVRR